MNFIQPRSVISCPMCGFQKEEVMSGNSCAYFYECTSCRQIIKPKEGDCCVFCSYGTVKCPPVQKGDSCC